MLSGGEGVGGLRATVESREWGEGLTGSDGMVVVGLGKNAGGTPFEAQGKPAVPGAQDAGSRGGSLGGSGKAAVGKRDRRRTVRAG